MIVVIIVIVVMVVIMVMVVFMVMPVMVMSFMVFVIMISVVMSMSFMVFSMIMSFMVFALSRTKLFIFRTFNNAMIVTSMFIMCWHTRSITAQNFSFSTCPSAINFRFESGNNMFHSHLGIFRHGRFHPTISFKSSSVQITPRKSNTIWFFGTFNTTIIS